MKHGVVTILLLVSLATFAHEKKLEPLNPPWKGSLQAGAVVNTGNNSSQNINGKIGIKYQTSQWDNTSSIEGQLDSSNKATNTEKIDFNAELRRIISDDSYLFAKTEVAYDRFGAYDFVIRSAVGYGRILYRDDKTRFILEVGPGSSHSRISGSRKFQNEFIVSTMALYKRKLSESASFKQKIKIDAGQRNTHIKSVSALRTKISKRLGLELSYTMDYDTKIPPETKNTTKLDTVSKIAVVFDF